tara:strand:+ start:406 stop:711 length:306 start_codon:yes stop_codon:yes gene_type:complete
MRERNIYSKNKVNSDKGIIKKPLKYPFISLSAGDMYVTTIDGDRLDLMANQFYGDTRLWWIIAQANPNTLRRDSYGVPSGLEIRIPMNYDQILKNFKLLNK